MTEEITSRIELLRTELENKKNIISGYEKVLKFNEEELKNADAIIKMYESIVEYARTELKDAKENYEATIAVSSMSRNELLEAFAKIKKLEEANRKLKEKSGESSMISDN